MSEKSGDPSTLKDRIIAVYAKHTGAESAYGAMTWFGKHCEATRRAVYRWCDEEMVKGEHMRILRLLEAMPVGTPWARDPDLLEAPLPDGFPTRTQLVSAGFSSQADVYHALDEELLKVDGVGPSTLERIRTWWEDPNHRGEEEQ